MPTSPQSSPEDRKEGHSVTLYSTTFCPFCSRAKALLKAKGVAWDEINLDNDPEQRQTMLRRSGGQRTVPQIFVGERHLGGFDDIAALDAQGRLDAILGLSTSDDHASEANASEAAEETASTDARSPRSAARRRAVRRKVVILGSGPAGYTAAIYAARANLAPLLVSGNAPGGQLTTTTDVENYPGYPKGIMGPQMMDDFRNQAERFGTDFRAGDVQTVDLTQHPFRLTLAQGEAIAAEALIISTGATARWLGLESEERLKNRGVSACATCDGFFFRDQDLAVIGGGDTAMEEALFLANLARKVTIIHRRETLRASQVMQDRARKHPKIRFLWNRVVEEVLGDAENGVSALKLRDPRNGHHENLAVQGMFVAIGHQPNTALFASQLAMDEQQYLKVQPGTTRTSTPGVFAAGDVADPHYRQAVTAAGTGCMAAIDAERWLAENTS